MKPQISIIVPYFEGKRWLLRAVRSVQTQKGVSWELIVIDDGSKESPQFIPHSLSDSRISLVRKKHAGKGDALNRGIGAAQAEIICFLDQDDLMLPGRLKNQLAAFAKNPVADAVYSDYERVFEDGTLIDRFISYQASNQECLHNMARGKALVSMQTIMIRKDTIIRIGGFSGDPKLMGLDDVEFLVRLFAFEPILIYEPGLVQQWIQHGNNYSRSGQFQEARLILLDHLSTLAKNHAIIQKELPHFRFHTFYMRGLFNLENMMAKKAIPEFWRAICSCPFNWNAYYLFIRSLINRFTYQ